jgi:hypothetical protein
VYSWISQNKDQRYPKHLLLWTLEPGKSPAQRREYKTYG